MKDDTIKKRAFGAFLSVMVSYFIPSMLQASVGTAMPQILNDIGGMSMYWWVFDAFTLSMALVIPIFGKLSDIFGRKYLYITGLVIFIVASFFGGISHNIYWLIGASAAQGVGGGAILAIGPAIIGDYFPSKERGKYQGFVGGVLAVASVLGPLLSGYLVGTVGWRWVFFINIPIGLGAILMDFIFLSKTSPNTDKNATIDYRGITTLSVMLFSMLLGFTYVSIDNTWFERQTLALFFLSAIFFFIFYRVEHRQKNPVIDFKLFGNEVFSIFNILSFLTEFAMYGSFIYIPLFVEAVQGKTALNTGVILAPMMLSAILTSIISGIYFSKTGKYKLITITGIILMAYGLYRMSYLTPSSSDMTLYLDMMIIGLGMGLELSIPFSVLQGVVSKKELGVALSSERFFNSVGGVVGAAVIGTVVNTYYEDKISTLPKILNYVMPKEFLQWMNNPQLLMEKQRIISSSPIFARSTLESLLNEMTNWFSQAINNAFFIAFLVMASAAVVAIFLKRVKITN
ncbi:MAG: DHA2 family efflux MFS transporter permease subunit [Athalassotoga sp.]|uniref:DHA2 family efflux MFS transporter permease subunit n=1 Tax=Athalassotoga sp. TaxID=2022597 RepID=UPI003D03ED2E